MLSFYKDRGYLSAYCTEGHHPAEHDDHCDYPAGRCCWRNVAVSDSCYGYDGIPECVKERRYLAVVPPFRHQYGEHEQDEEREKRRNAFIEG